MTQETRVVRLELPCGGVAEARQMALALAGSGLLFDTSAAPSVWGEAFVGLDATLALTVEAPLRRARPGLVRDLMEGEVVRALSALRRRKLDAIILPVTSNADPDSLREAVGALREASGEGLIAGWALAPEDEESLNLCRSLHPDAKVWFTAGLFQGSHAPPEGKTVGDLASAQACGAGSRA